MCDISLKREIAFEYVQSLNLNYVKL